MNVHTIFSFSTIDALIYMYKFYCPPPTFIHIRITQGITKPKIILSFLTLPPVVSISSDKTVTAFYRTSLPLSVSTDSHNVCREREFFLAPLTLFGNCLTSDAPTFFGAEFRSFPLLCRGTCPNKHFSTHNTYFVGGYYLFTHPPSLSKNRTQCNSNQ